MENNYILRARVIEGSIPMPIISAPDYKRLTENNFEIFAPYTKDNFHELFAIAKEAYAKGDLSKFEILAWAGGANNHDGDRYLWSFRPDLWNFRHVPRQILQDFDLYTPKPLPGTVAPIYEQFWKKIKFGFSLAAYKAYTNQQTTSLDEKFFEAQIKSSDQPIHPISKQEEIER